MFCFSKWVIGARLATLLVGRGIFLKFRGIKKQAQKLCKENIVLSNLPEKIYFQAAKLLKKQKSLQKKFYKKFSLEGLNYANEGLTIISNANKGKIYLLPILEFVKKDQSMIAGIDISPFDKEFGTLTINSKYFDNEYLDEKLVKNYPIGL